MKPGARRKLVSYVREVHDLSERRACGLMGITRWTNRYRSRRDPQEELKLRLRELAASRVRYGYRRLPVLLRRGGGR
jgi:putative transposase